MSTTDSALLQETIRRTLAFHAGSAPDTRAVAEATLSIWRQVAAQLSPVIGARGVDVLFSRSLHLTSNTFPWLASVGDKADNTSPLASFMARLEAREAAEAAEASYALLVTFTKLLATLIGDSLTKRLLRPVWAPQPSTSKQETAS